MVKVKVKGYYSIFLNNGMLLYAGYTDKEIILDCIYDEDVLVIKADEYEIIKETEQQEETTQENEQNTQ